MKVIITARKTIVKDSFKEKVEKRLAKFDRFFGEEATANVTVTHEGDREIVEVTIKFKGMTYRAERTTEDRAISFDAVCDVLMKQIVKNKKKLDKKVKSEAFVDLHDFADEPEEEYKIVKSKKYSIRPMTAEDAILNMNLIDHQFFIFNNAETGKVNLIYRRNDGNYGLIEPGEDEE